MKIYKDIISGDEMFMDSNAFKLVHNAVYRVEGKYITRSKVGELVLGGANPSAEDEVEGADDGSESGIDIVLNMRLNETGFSDKKSYVSYLKEYTKTIAGRLAEESPDEVEVFKTGANGFIKENLSKFKDMRFFLGDSMNPDGMTALLIYEEEDGDEKPFFYYFKHGLLEEKV